MTITTIEQVEASRAQRLHAQFVVSQLEDKRRQLLKSNAYSLDTGKYNTEMNAITADLAKANVAKGIAEQQATEAETALMQSPVQLKQGDIAAIVRLFEYVLRTMTLPPLESNVLRQLRTVAGLPPKKEEL